MPPMNGGRDPRAPRLGWRQAFLLYAVYGAGVVAVTWPLVLSPATLWPLHHDARVPAFEHIAHAGQRLELHTLDVNLDAVNRVISPGDHWPQPIEARDGHRHGPCVRRVRQGGISHPASGRKAPHLERVWRPEAEGHDRHVA